MACNVVEFGGKRGEYDIAIPSFPTSILYVLSLFRQRASPQHPLFCVWAVGWYHHNILSLGNCRYTMRGGNALATSLKRQICLLGRT